MLNLLETFCAVVQAGSINKAAESLHLSQPAITRQIKALEKDLGAVLLTRSTHGVELTPAGEAILPFAHQALSAVAGCRQAAARAAGQGAERLAIASGLMILLFSLHPVIERFRELWPSVAIDLRPGNWSESIDKLLAYEVDVAFLSTPLQVAGVKGTPLFKDPLLLVGAPGSNRAPNGETAATMPRRLADLEGQPLLMLPPEAGLRGELGREIEARGIEPKVITHPTVETIKLAVSLGMGWTILPSSAIRDEVKAGKLAAEPIEDWAEAVRTIRAYTRAEGALPEPARHLIALMREAYGR
ncbi:MAG TPA: LysR family transcriptional regulator [Symbiobacteriaceae bacterium]|nr:LysR family transcriptional regulator [Symbiobacteriaceae bacterium]